LVSIDPVVLGVAEVGSEMVPEPRTRRAPSIFSAHGI
jgi:hypothetical protein